MSENELTRFNVQINGTNFQYQLYLQITRLKYPYILLIGLKYKGREIHTKWSL